MDLIAMLRPWPYFAASPTMASRVVSNPSLTIFRSRPAAMDTGL